MEKTDTIFKTKPQMDPEKTIFSDLPAKKDEAELLRENFIELFGEEKAEEVEQIMKQKQEEEKQKQKQEEERLINSLPYLVHGTQLYCTCGTHKRRLNLPMDHGAYVLGKALICEEDCVANVNILPFGICQSEDNPVNNSWFKKLGDTIFDTDERTEEQKDAEKILLQLENGENVKGYACTPCIVSKWKLPYLPQKVARYGMGGERVSVLTVDSFLVCAYGGTIQSITSGQESD